MTQDEIIEMAVKAGMGFNQSLAEFSTPLCDGVEIEELEAFAKLVAEKATEKANARANASWTLMCKKMVAAEREACAKVCDEKVDAEYATGKVDHNEMGWTQACSIAIRARGQE